MARACEAQSQRSHAHPDRTIGSLVVYVIAVYLGPETRGKVMTADLEVIEVDPEVIKVEVPA
jgi:hypothetical protein